jgi:hypothetical protein
MGMAIDAPPTAPEHAPNWRRVKATIFLLIGMGAIGWLLVDQRRAGLLRNLPSSGTRVEGRVKEMKTLRGGNLLTLGYEFSVAGSPYEILDRKVADFDGLQPKGAIEVWLDPSDPRTCITRNELRHARFGKTPLLFAGLVVLVMAAAALQTRRPLQAAHGDDPSD